VAAAVAESEAMSVCWAEQLDDTLAWLVVRSGSVVVVFVVVVVVVVAVVVVVVVVAVAVAFGNIDRRSHKHVDHRRGVEVEVAPVAPVYHRDDHNGLVAVSMQRNPLRYGCNFVREAAGRQWRLLQRQRQWKMTVSVEQASGLIVAKEAD
jgi:MFS superfamily sulfate permease-like transporter